MLQRVSAFKPARAASCISRCINYEARTYSTSSDNEKVSAVYQRLGLDFSDPSLMTQSVTHKSFAHGTVPTNEKLGLLDLHVTERNWDKVKANKTLRSTVAMSLSSEKLAKVARSMGVNEVMRWKSPSSSPDSKVGEDTVLAHTMEAIVGAVYHDKGSKAAREFVAKHVYTY
ncbi:hypothetical protein BGZ70_004422 [Mortierella alpina]|uniref:RNase III domain-containing protein n=1 Tax=Mortierella alpina TaxID=64518 RepID=A0A9P6M429_MORAP|nr:hypothetical protein BGZ70_004422 [Mortierella alpina]